jgi:hypothetical protein
VRSQYRPLQNRRSIGAFLSLPHKTTTLGPRLGRGSSCTRFSGSASETWIHGFFAIGEQVTVQVVCSLGCPRGRATG